MTRLLLVSLALATPLPAAVFNAFEGDGFNDWKADGSAFGLAPAAGSTDGMEAPFTAYAGDSLAASTHGGNDATGTLTSPEFTLRDPYITFLIAGGDLAGKTAVQLVIDGKVEREAVGRRSLRLEPVVWDVAALKGRKAVIRLMDGAAGEWGFIAADHFILTDYPNQKFPPTTRAGKPFVEGLVESAAVPGASIPPGASLAVAATFADQQLTSPTALTFDDQGRIYISETHRFREGIEDDRDHLYWYLDDLASKKTADRRALHEKWKEKVPLESLTRKSEVIRRLADTDGNGRIDESKVFADGFNDVLDGTAAGIFHYEGSLYFACIPKIYQLLDTNGDGVADERKVLQDGFGVRISLSGHDLNGFTLGPDGRIYGTVGDRGFSFITREGKNYDYPDEGAVFRFDPDGSHFELFHTGLRNPKEIAFDDRGNPFTVDNNSDQGDAARIVYLVEGGDSGWQMEHQAMHSFHRQIGLEEHPPSRWMDERMWEMENPAQPAYILPPSALLTAGPSGLTYHPGAGFLQSEAGRFLICDYRGGSANSGIWSFAMKEKGAGMAMADSRQFAWGIAATDVEYSWDGKVYITDFMGGWKSHDEGRLLALDAGAKTWQANEVAGAVRLMKQGFDERSSAELLVFLRHPDARIRLRAQIALTRKPDAVSKLIEATRSSSQLTRLHGIWGLGILTRRGPSPLPASAFKTIPDSKTQTDAENHLIALLGDPDPEVRAQTLRVLADSASSKPVSLGPALTDASPRVRFFAAILAGKRNLIGYYGPICDLLAENDNRDVYLRHACIFALEKLGGKNPRILNGLVTHESAAVRLAATVALRRLGSPDIANFVQDSDPKVADEAIRAIVDLDLASCRPAVSDWLDALDSRTWSPFMLRRLVHNAYRLGTAEEAARVLRFAGDAAQPEIVRREAFRLLSLWTDPFPADQLTGHWRPLAKRDAATVKPALLAALPALLKQDGFALAATLGLARTYQLESPLLAPEALRRMTRNPALDSASRAAALDLLVARQPDQLGPLARELATDASDEVALTALATLAKSAPEAALPLLEAAVTGQNITRAQKAWPLLASLPGADPVFVRALDALREAHGRSPTALELTAAARSRKAAPVKAALHALDQALAADPDPLARWNGSLEGGDPAKGAALFASHPASECRRCHRAEEGHAAGGDTAPNLLGIARRHPDRRYFLESLLAPAAVIAPGFGTVLVELNNGAAVTGNLREDTPDHLDLDTPQKAVRIRRSDIASVTPPASPMPSMEKLLNPGELRDLIAWLATLDQGGEAAAPPAAAPEVLDPATLAKPADAPVASAIDPAVMKLGRQQFMVCGACHGQSGEGTAAGPPLAGSEWVTGPAENLIRIQLRGLQGPIVVKGQTYHMPAGMAALAYQTDEQIAAVLTFIRNSFGNTAPAVAPAEVAALRPEVGNPPVTAADLIPPSGATAGSTAPAAPAAAAASDKYADLAPSRGTGKWIAIGAVTLLLAASVVALKMKR